MDINKEQLEQIIDEFEQRASSLSITKDIVTKLKALIKPEKWEPKGGYVRLTNRGGIVEFTDNDEEYRKNGGQYPTIELAETARDMNKRNQLILQAKHEMGYGDGGYIISFRVDERKWKSSDYWAQQIDNPELTFETKEQAETVIEMVRLNE